MSKVHRIGYIGLGNAGYPLAGLLPKNGYTVVVRDADAARAEEFAAEHEGAKVAVEGSKGFSDVDMLVTMLPNGDVVRQVLLGGDGVEGVASGLKDDTIIIDTSSASPLTTRTLGSALHALNPSLTLVDAPITQHRAHALATGDATLMVGCDSTSALERAMPVLRILGKHVFVMGGLGCGHAMKTLNNYTSAASILGLCDALVAGQKFGLDAAAMLDVMNVGTGRNFSTAEAFRTDGLTRTWQSGYQLSLLVKDVKIAKQVIESVGIESQLPDLAISYLSDALQVADEGACHTQCIKGWEARAGIQLERVETAHPDTAAGL